MAYRHADFDGRQTLRRGALADTLEAVAKHLGTGVPADGQ